VEQREEEKGMETILSPTPKIIKRIQREMKKIDAGLQQNKDK
jgi:c-di-GMP-binding flagellar brake protein YcgR